MISESDLFKIYQALGNPHRRKIIMLLGENPDGLAFSELKRELNLSVGTLYYNLDQLGDLVHQKSDKRYALTEKGFIAYKMLKSDIEKIKNEGATSGLSGLTDTLRGVFFPRWFFTFLESKKNLTPIAAFIVLLVGGFACGYNGIVLNVTWIAYSSIPALCSLSFIWSWLVIAIISFLAIPPNTSEKLKRLPRYLAEVGLAMFPLAIFVVIEPVLRVTIVARVVVQVILWLLALMLISSALSHATRCRGETAFLVTALVMFVMTIAIPQLLVPPP